MKSLVLLMIEPEQPESLSARKLVVETAKHNVITAYNSKSGLELLRRFPNIDAVIVHSQCLETNPRLLIELKQIAAGTPLVVASPGRNETPPEADFVIDSHRPDSVMQLLAGPLQASLEN